MPHHLVQQTAYAYAILYDFFYQFLTYLKTLLICKKSAWFEANGIFSTIMVISHIQC